jgi:hypothetical protein
MYCESNKNQKCKSTPFLIIAGNFLIYLLRVLRIVGALHINAVFILRHLGEFCVVSFKSVSKAQIKHVHLVTFGNCLSDVFRK